MSSVDTEFNYATILQLDDNVLKVVLGPTRYPGAASPADKKNANEGTI